MGFDEDRSTRTSSDVVYEGWVMKRGFLHFLFLYLTNIDK